jgi:dTDP-4-dehydrorhamnose 3,5-epimerase
MIFRDTPIDGVKIVEAEPQLDIRGSFSRLWCANEFSEAGLDVTFAQSSLSRNRKKFTVRGMHYQVPPSREAKLVYCTSGRIFDVVADLREDSPTHGALFTIELDAGAARPLALYIPPQCAHGFQTLEDDTDVLYCMTQVYEPQWSRAINWRSTELAIPWPRIEGVTMSEADRNAPQLAALVR